MGTFLHLASHTRRLGWSFYTIREIVREIIQENRVLGTSDLILNGKGDDQTVSRSTVVMDPVPPLSLSPDGLHSPSDQNHYMSSEPGETKSPVNGENINGSKVGLEDRGSNVVKFKEVNGYQLSQEDVEHESVGSIDISGTQFAASCGEEHDTKHDDVQTICDCVYVKPQDKEVEVDNKDRGFESGSCKNDLAKSEVTSVERASMEKGKIHASDSSSSQKGNIATLNRIKPESWKGQSNVAGQETNPLLAVLKVFLTAFVKFWSE